MQIAALTADSRPMTSNQFEKPATENATGVFDTSPLPQSTESGQGKDGGRGDGVLEEVCVGGGKAVGAVRTEGDFAPETSSISGMDAGVKRLGDNVFTLWGGRSRTPSIDGEDKAYQCKGGPGKLNCGQVVDPSKNGEAGLKCDYCGEWYHAACQQVPKTAVTAVGKFSMIHWFCAPCRVSLFDHKPESVSLGKMSDSLLALENGVIKKVSERIEDMTKVVSDHIKLVNRALSNQEQMAVQQERLLERCVKELHDQKTSYADIVKVSCADVAKDMSLQFADIRKQKEQAEVPAKDIASTVGSVMDRERRKLNVVVSNLPESEPTDAQTREKQDLYQFHEFVKDAFHLNLKAPKCFRAGRLREGRPRLLVVTLEDVATKLELLRLSPSLRDIPEWKHIYINPDLTPAERDENRKLRQELASRREAGETNLVIRKGKIVKSHTAPVGSSTRAPQASDKTPPAGSAKARVMGSSAQEQ